MSKLIWHSKHICTFLFIFFSLFSGYCYLIKDNSELGQQSFFWACAYLILEFGFLSMLKSRLSVTKQPKYKIVFLYENRMRAENITKNIEEIKEMKPLLSEPNVDSCVLMDYEMYLTLNPTLNTNSFPYFIVINGENLINESLLLKKPLYHDSSYEGVIEFLRKQQHKKSY